MGWIIAPDGRTDGRTDGRARPPSGRTRNVMASASRPPFGATYYNVYLPPSLPAAQSDGLEWNCGPARIRTESGYLFPEFQLCFCPSAAAGAKTDSFCLSEMAGGRLQPAPVSLYLTIMRPSRPERPWMWLGLPACLGKAGKATIFRKCGKSQPK